MNNRAAIEKMKAKLAFIRSALATETNDCIEWPFEVDEDGYGRIHHKGFYRAHRLAYFLSHGAIPDSKRVCHSCDNPKCLNRNHWFLGTDKDNSTDRDQKRRTAVGSDSGSAKLTEQQVIEIRAAYQKGVYGKGRYVLAKQYNVHVGTIQHLLSGHTWKDLTRIKEKNNAIAGGKT